MSTIPKAGEQVTLKMLVHKNTYDNNLTLLAIDMSEYGYPCYGMVDVTFTMPDCDPSRAMIDSLNAQIEKEKAEHHVKITQLEGRIQELLAIGHDGGAA